MRVSPMAELSQTLTSHLETGAAGVGRADSITQATAGVAMRSDAGLVTGALDYKLSALAYARASNRNSLRQTLQANGNAEWYERRGFVSVQASISQQAISAFGLQTIGTTAQASTNTTDVAHLSVAPRWLGVLPAGLRYMLFADYEQTEVSSTNVGDNNRFNMGFHLAPQTEGRIRWSADLLTAHSRYRAGRRTDTTTGYGTLNYRVEELDTQLSASVGGQRSNLVDLEQTDSSYWNLGAVWMPSLRTTLRANVGERMFGRSYDLAFEHRMALLVVRLSDSRSLSDGTQLGNTVLGTAYDLFYAMYASREPDPVKRADLVDATLRARGIDANAAVSGGFLASSATVLDRQSLSLGMQWPRSSAMLIFNQGGSRRASRRITVFDDLSSNMEVRTAGVTLVLTHALTASTSVNLSLSGQQSRGDTASQSHDQRALNLHLSDRISSSLSWVLALRRSLFQTGAIYYNESAITASVAAQF